MRKLIFFSGLFLLLMFFSQPVSADLSWTINPYVQAQQEYTDNLFQDRDDRESDWITVLGAGLDLRGIGPTEGITLNYFPSYAYYHENDDLSTLRHKADLELWKYIRRHLRISFLNVFEHSEEPYVYYDPPVEIDPDVIFIDEDYLRIGRETRSINTARPRLDYQFGPRDRFYFQYSWRQEWNDNPAEEDKGLHTPSAGLTYWFSRFYGLETDLRYTRGIYDESEDRDVWDGRLRLLRNFTRHLDGYVEYRHTHVDYSRDRPGYTAYQPSAGISYTFAREGRFRAGVGYIIRDKEDNGTEERLVLDAVIDKTWSQRRSSFTLRGSTGYTEAFLREGDGFTIFYDARAIYSYGLRRDLDWRIAAGFRHRDYRDREPTRRDNVFDIGTGLNYRWTRHVNVGLNYDYRNVDSDRRASEYYENRATLTLNWVPSPRRLN